MDRNYTIAELRRAIPANCFVRSTSHGLLYLISNILFMVAIFQGFYTSVTPDTIPWRTLRIILWIVYTAIEGLLATGLWILAHECGHQAFSQYGILNDFIGWILHSTLLVPYFSFKISHAQHHNFNAHLEKDVVFLPKTYEQYTGMLRCSRELCIATEDMPVRAVGQLILMQLFGWPMYLLTNINGQNFDQGSLDEVDSSRPQKVHINHFDYRNPLFKPKDAYLIILSDIGCLAMLALLYIFTRQFGLHNVLAWYFAPYLWVNHWVVAITYLQHTAVSVPHYDSRSWTFVKGAAATIDRDLGFIGRHFFYNVVETHVVHHHFPKIPFYHAREATLVIKSLMGEHYMHDDKTGMMAFLYTLWVTIRTCLWVEERRELMDERVRSGTYWFNNKQGDAATEASKFSNRMRCTD